MTHEELIKLRRELLHHNSEQLKRIYLDHKKECISFMMVRMNISKSRAEDVFTDALLVLRQNIISKKIKKLSSIKAYLNSTCINMVRESWNYDNRMRKKETDVRLLFYGNCHISHEEQLRMDDLQEVCNLAFSRLSAKCQEILIAFYVYKIPMKEIAEEYGFASGDVAKMTKSRCYKQWIKEVKKLIEHGFR